MIVSIQTLYAIHDRMTEMAAVESEAALKALDGDRRDDCRTRCAAAQAATGCALVVLQFIRDGLDMPQQSGSSDSNASKGDTRTGDAAAAAFWEWMDSLPKDDKGKSYFTDGFGVMAILSLDDQRIWKAGFEAGRKA